MQSSGPQRWFPFLSSAFVYSRHQDPTVESESKVLSLKCLLLVSLLDLLEMRSGDAVPLGHCALETYLAGLEDRQNGRSLSVTFADDLSGRLPPQPVLSFDTKATLKAIGFKGTSYSALVPKRMKRRINSGSEVTGTGIL